MVVPEVWGVIAWCGIVLQGWSAGGGWGNQTSPAYPASWPLSRASHHLISLWWKLLDEKNKLLLQWLLYHRSFLWQCWQCKLLFSWWRAFSRQTSVQFLDVMGSWWWQRHNVGPFLVEWQNNVSSILFQRTKKKREFLFFPFRKKSKLLLEDDVCQCNTILRQTDAFSLKQPNQYLTKKKQHTARS